MRGHADRTGAERVVGFRGPFRVGRLLHQRHGLGVAAERALDEGARHLVLDCDLSRPVEVLCVRKRLLQRREPVEIGARLLRPAAARESDRAREMRHRFGVRVAARPRRQASRRRPVETLQRPARFHRRHAERTGTQAGLVLARDQVILDLERKIERFLGLGVLSELQMGIDEIIERVDAILRRAPVGFRGLRRVVCRDRVLPAAEQHVGMRRHVDRMRHDGHADRVVLRRGERAVDQRRIVVGVNDVMAGAGVLRLLREHLLQNPAGLELIPVGLV